MQPTHSRHETWLVAVGAAVAIMLGFAVGRAWMAPVATHPIVASTCR